MGQWEVIKIDDCFKALVGFNLSGWVGQSSLDHACGIVESRLPNSPREVKPN